MVACLILKNETLTIVGEYFQINAMHEIQREIPFSVSDFFTKTEIESRTNDNEKYAVEMGIIFVMRKKTLCGRKRDHTRRK